MPITSRTRVVLAAAIGNTVEWYDFGLYGLLAPVLASLFFPSDDRFAALIGVYGGFAVGFAVRPIGAVVLGRIGDRRGRQFVLVLSVVLMGASTLAIGLLPSFRAIGIFAPILLILIRLFQGFSVGGEFVGSVTYLVETAELHRRGIAGSVANLGATIGMLLAAGAAAITLSFASSVPEIWRVPFLLGGLLAFFAYILRRHLPPEELQQEAAHASHSVTPPSRQTSEPQTLISRLCDRWPAMQAFREAPRTMAIALLFTFGYGVSNYLIMVFLPTFAREFAYVNQATALAINTVGQALALAIVPLAGWISDHWIRRRTLMALAFLLQAASAWMLFQLVLAHGSRGLWAAQLVLAGLLAVVMGTAPAMLSEQFARGYRVSGHAFVLNVGIGIGGGTSPLIAVALIHATQNNLAASIYLAFGCLMSAITISLLADFSRQTLARRSN